jgi:hypothetical protein
MTTMRATPLAALPAEASVPAAAPRADPFESEVRTLRIGTARVQLSERLLLVLGGVLAPLGLVVVLLGWWGAARTPLLFEQVPYLISGGLLGLGLVFLGSFLYFTHWVTQLVQEHRTQSRALLDAIGDLQAQVAGLADPRQGAASTNGHQPVPDALVATERGSMAHRRDCVVVAGKHGLHAVSPSDGRRPCKLCEPY